MVFTVLYYYTVLSTKIKKAAVATEEKLNAIRTQNGEILCESGCGKIICTLHERCKVYITCL